ncbi:hypothetical protein GCM10022393_35420 [Aquimarina addita]|uniref:Uncharacterized protein n=2 Tax=Aquimarina addita TaxID=870485 RepID=A0ABP6UUN2_9FLAO
MVKNATTLYVSNPDIYEGYQNVNIGKILAIIGIVLNVASILFSIFSIGMDGYYDIIEGMSGGGGYSDDF